MARRRYLRSGPSFVSLLNLLRRLCQDPSKASLTKSHQIMLTFLNKWQKKIMAQTLKNCAQMPKRHTTIHPVSNSSYKDGWLVCGNEYKCDHFSMKDGTWNGKQNLLRPLSPGTCAIIGILDTVIIK